MVKIRQQEKSFLFLFSFHVFLTACFLCERQNVILQFDEFPNQRQRCEAMLVPIWHTKSCRSNPHGKCRTNGRGRKVVKIEFLNRR